MKLKSWGMLALGVLLLVGEGESAAAKTRHFFSPGGHFALYCREQDLADGSVTLARLRKWANWLDTAHAKLTGQPLGFREPFGAREIAGRPRIVVGVVRFRQSTHADIRNLASIARGLANHQGMIYLNLDYFGDDTQDQANQCTIAHELFHMIQMAYDLNEDVWIEEAMARWAPGAVFPEIDQSNYCIRAEIRFVKRVQLPLHYDPGVSGNDRRQRTGHPYGGSVFFRFLWKQAGGDAVLRRIWEKCADKPGPNGLEAVKQALGGEISFREVFDRFALGTVLHDLAPADCRLTEVQKLTENGHKAKAPLTSLAAGWMEYCRQQAFKPSDTGYKPTFTAPPGNPLGQGSAGVGGGAEPVTGWAGGMGIRAFAIPKPPDLPKNTALEAIVRSAPNEISVQAVARFGAERTLRVFKAGYYPAIGSYKLHIPDMDQVGPNVYLVATRYSAVQDAKNFPMTLKLVTPPTLKVKITWNTADDVDLWVEEPMGQKCWYQNRTTRNGGRLNQDNTWGFGPGLADAPEEYTMADSVPGDYVIKVNYYSGPRKKGVSSTTVKVEVTQSPSRPGDATRVDVYTVTLSKRGETREVCRVTIPQAKN